MKAIVRFTFTIAKVENGFAGHVEFNDHKSDSSLASFVGDDAVELTSRMLYYTNKRAVGMATGPAADILADVKDISTESFDAAIEEMAEDAVLEIPF